MEELWTVSEGFPGGYLGGGPSFLTNTSKAGINFLETRLNKYKNIFKNLILLINKICIFYILK